MAAGFQCWTDSGFIQITEGVANPVLVQSGSVTTVTNTIPGAPLIASVATISYTAASSDHHPLCAVRPNGPAVLLGVSRSGLVWTWTYLSTEAVGSSLAYWIFDLKTDVPASGLFEIYNAAGQRVFSAAQKPLRIRDVITGTMGSTLAWTNTSTYDSGRTYAAMPARWSEQAVYRALPDETSQLALGVSGATNGITRSAVELVRTTGDSTPSPFTATEVIVIDVTHY